MLRRAFAVCAFAFVVVSSVATSPARSPPFGLEAELNDAVNLSPSAPRVTRIYTARLNAAGNAPITDGGLPLVATLRLSGGFTEPSDIPSRDAGAFDAGSFDAGSFDAGALDAGSPDAGSPDAGELDGGELDGGLDAGSLDAGELDAGALPRRAFELRDNNGRVIAFARMTGVSPNGAPVDVDAALFVGCAASSACEQEVTVEFVLDPSVNALVTAIVRLEASAASGALSPSPADAQLSLSSR